MAVLALAVAADRSHGSYGGYGRSGGYGTYGGYGGYDTPPPRPASQVLFECVQADPECPATIICPGDLGMNLLCDDLDARHEFTCDLSWSGGARGVVHTTRSEVHDLAQAFLKNYCILCSSMMYVTYFTDGSVTLV